MRWLGGDYSYGCSVLICSVGGCSMLIWGGWQEIATSDSKANLIFSPRFFCRPPFHTNSLAASSVTTNTLCVTTQGDSSNLWIAFLEEDVCLVLSPPRNVEPFGRCWQQRCQWMSGGWWRWFRAAIKLIVPLAETNPQEMKTHWTDTQDIMIVIWIVKISSSKNICVHEVGLLMASPNDYLSWIGSMI